MTEKIARFLNEEQPPTPCLVVDLDVVAEKYRALRHHLPLAEIFYAVKANPAPEIVRLLNDLGSSFDVASTTEVDLCLSLDVAPARLSFGSTIKKERDIAYAYDAGVDLFAFDAEAELKKLAKAAPDSRVTCRLFVDNAGADWPLSRKFGCDLTMARDLLLQAADLGLIPDGVSFHVGSQQTRADQWDGAIGMTAELLDELENRGLPLRNVNLGGGFPARYRDEVAGIGAYGEAIMHAMTKHFGNRLPTMSVEPGRYLVGDAGVLQSEVVLISRKSYDDERRWVYLDVGRFGGLAETEGEAIKYRVQTPRDGEPTGPVVLAGPTCDSADILYENAGYEMPLSLEIGDKVEFLATGAYTTTYSSVGFNGFAPLKQYFV